MYLSVICLFSLHDALPISLCDRIAILHGGRIRAMGTMADLRKEAATGDAHLEDIFLKLTGSEGVKEDRKSTRLNSSHLVISYAVFCLKKKILYHNHTLLCI